MASKVKFKTTILLKGNNTGIVVPEEVVTKLDAGKRPPVVVTVNGYTYRNSIASMGGQFLISVSADVRKHTGIVGGETLDIILELDTAPREVAVPADLAKALKADAAANKFFETLPYSSRLRYVLAIEQAKTEETRNKRIAKTIEDLRAGKK